MNRLLSAVTAITIATMAMIVDACGNDKKTQAEVEAVDVSDTAAAVSDTADQTVDNADTIGKGSSAAAIDSILSSGMGRRPPYPRPPYAPLPDFLVNGDRTHASIQYSVTRNEHTLRNAYNRRLRDNPTLQGTILLYLAIEEDYGNVIFTKIIVSTMNEPAFENTVAEIVKRWNFHRIDKGSITEVIYPFVFEPQ